MAVVVTAVSGDSLGYVWHQQAGQEDANGYYIDAADSEQRAEVVGRPQPAVPAAACQH